MFFNALKKCHVRNVGDLDLAVIKGYHLYRAQIHVQIFFRFLCIQMDKIRGDDSKIKIVVSVASGLENKRYFKNLCN